VRFVESPSTASSSSWTASEASVLAALRAGDEGAFLELVQRLHGAMLRVASWHLSTRASAEEVVQSDSEDGPSVPAERFLDDQELWSGNWAQPPMPWPDARLESGEVVALVREALDSLPEAQQTVMALRDVADWDPDEVCELLGISMGNQRVLLHRARSRVRGFIEARLGQEVPG
jgi:RNA polymerase sigma-70 factor (ECF subfamily)